MNFPSYTRRQSEGAYSDTLDLDDDELSKGVLFRNTLDLLRRFNLKKAFIDPQNVDLIVIEVKRMAYLCTKHVSALRPRIERVLPRLEPMESYAAFEIYHGIFFHHSEYIYLQDLGHGQGANTQTTCIWIRRTLNLIHRTLNFLRGHIILHDLEHTEDTIETLICTSILIRSTLDILTHEEQDRTCACCPAL